MRQRVVVSFLLVITGASSVGCGTMNPALRERVAEQALPLAPSVEDDEAVVRLARDAAAGELPAPVASALPEQAGLEDYVSIALRENPAIRRAVREVQALGYRVPQVTSLDDPMINLVPPTGDMTETAAGMMSGGVGVSQRLPFPGKLSARGRMAEQSVRMALDELADVRISTVADVQKAYYRYYLAEVSAQITRESQDLLAQIREVAAARYRAGAATQQDVLRAEVRLYDLTNQLITLEQQRATAQARLNSLMNRPVDAPLPPSRPFDLAAVDWKLSEALARAVESNPQLARLRNRIGRDLEAIRLARLEYYPDLTAGFAYSFIGSGMSPVADGGDVWDLSFGLNVPIWWQRLRAGVLEGNAQVLASVEDYAELRNLVSYQLQDALVKIDTQYRRAALFRDLIVPRAWQTVEVSTSAYRAGSLEFTALFDTWRDWLKFSLAYHRSLAELEQRFADLQQLIGLRVGRAPDEKGSGAVSEGLPNPLAEGDGSNASPGAGTPESEQSSQERSLEK